MNWGSAQSRQGQGQGNRGWGSGSGNRFAALSDNRAPNNSRQQGGGGQRGAPTQAPNWRDVARQDLITEHVTWPASCYAHQRDGSNDLQGDLSFEEARWAAMCAARAGASQAQLAGAFQDAQKQRQQQIQALMNSNRPPSLGGSAVMQAGPSPLLMGSGSGLQQPQAAVPATPAGQTFAAFPPQQVGQASPAAAGGFGSAAFGAGGSNASRPAFGTAASPPANPFGSASPSAFAPSNRITFGSAQQSQQQRQTAAGGDRNPWTAPAFEAGKIPEDPPPPIYCH
ncbi:hypothetical protein WJX73_003121 [Symbiochloris irregularis]|uniref:Uncharacterized protein n=1 Tax=Symbiochloris irregularis TaxID=706552 RepID=A0AAW1PNG5_9CHLO